MVGHLGTLIHKLRFLLVGILIIGNLFLLSFLLSSLEDYSAQAKATDSSADVSVTDMSDSPNLVTSGMVLAAQDIERGTATTTRAINNGLQSAASATVQTGRFVGDVSKSVAHGVQVGVTTAARGIGTGIAFTGYTVGRSIVYLISIPVNILGLAADTPVASAVIRPADHNTEIPIIDPDSPALRAALSALPAAGTGKQKHLHGSGGPAWPMHGVITTEFGVAHWPYQATHTGIDISDARAPGVTPVKPFRPGKVIDVVHSSYGLGNYVVVDHGNGVTSVYAHLNSISVRTGQEVNMRTTLGLEGSTGASTGTHLHFEIRVNGQATNPRQFIAGLP